MHTALPCREERLPASTRQPSHRMLSLMRLTVGSSSVGHDATCSSPKQKYISPKHGSGGSQSLQSIAALQTSEPINSSSDFRLSPSSYTMSAGTTVQFQGHQDAPECSQYFASCNRSLLTSSSEMAWHEIEVMSISDPVSKGSVRPRSTD